MAQEARSTDGLPPWQLVYVYPRLRDFDPSCVRLVTRRREPSKFVAYFLGFLRLVFGASYQEILHASDQDEVWLEEKRRSPAAVQEDLRQVVSDQEPPATMDDFYLLLGVMLCNLARPRGSNPNADWFRNRVSDLVAMFPGVSEPPPIPLYGQEEADAISAFGDRYPKTRAAICSVVLRKQFNGPMQLLQGYVRAGWQFSGMKHAQLIVKYLTGTNSWLLDAVPELRLSNGRLQEFLRVYNELGEDGPYLKLLNHPEQATALRKHLGLHVAAAYALAVVDDENWVNYKGVPRGDAEKRVFAIVSDIRRRGLSGPLHSAHGAAASAAVDDGLQLTMDLE
ncbi:hypothetical protein HPB50_002391 [Hyalomma asiaticum]|uniref:Uncharacterized protein n=1 Tax=Hyalomma asiaticum TaxID=266040 RepID=A0ACB7RQ45_HYAAI|nr:hypothetical protein HPB50_002391 [Hyalomma asiaticum]